MIQLELLKRDIENIYELNISYNIYDFLITCPEIARRYDSGPCFINTREKLLIQQEQDNLNLSLYLHNDILDNLEKHAPEKGLDTNNFEDFCLALEGVSHFLYMIWKASYNKSVTLLELELQAEIDKFIVLSEYLHAQKVKLADGDLRKVLFNSISYHESLGRTEIKRYRAANSYAGRYCELLETRYMNRGNNPALLNDLRRFYRLNQSDKLRHIKRGY